MSWPDVRRRPLRLHTAGAFFRAARILDIAESPDTPDPDDLTLFNAWADGDRDAGTRLVRRHFPSVYSFFRTRLPDQAEDLAQRTFLACVENQASFRRDGSFRAYLFGIARRQMLRSLEKKAIVARAQPKQGAPTMPTSPSGKVARREEELLLLRALRSLQLDDQVLMQLFYWERMSTEEIATVMELGRSAVKVRLHRARAQLREAIANDAAPAPIRTATLQDLDDWAASVRPDGDKSPS